MQDHAWEELQRSLHSAQAGSGKGSRYEVSEVERIRCGESLPGNHRKAHQGGQLEHQGIATIFKDAVPSHVFQGVGVTTVIKPNGEFVTLMESGVGRASEGTLKYLNPQQLLLPGHVPW